MKRRSRGQAVVVAAMAMIAMIGAVAIVVDWGVFYVLQREMQSAAEAGALAAVWYPPACPFSTGCQTSGPTPQGNCTDWSCQAATDFATANLGPATALCAPVNGQQYAINAYSAGSTPLGSDPFVSIYVVEISCQARHWMGTILPNVSPTMRIDVNAAATVGWLGANGDLSNTPLLPSPNSTLIARLFLSPS